MSNFVDEECVEVELDLGKHYCLPKEIAIVPFENKFLVIYTLGVLWLVLENDEELAVFEDIKSEKTIEDVLKLYSEDAVFNVLTQIEAKKFERPKAIEKNEKNIYIFLTNNCNQKCRHCYMFAGDIKIEEVPCEKWMDIINKLADSGCNGITFTGGEITVYKGFEQLIKHASKSGLKVTVLTNGILWTNRLIESLYKYIDEIQVSIDGYDKDSYFNVRQYDGFEKALYCVKKFSQLGTKVSIATTPLYDELDDFIIGFETFAKALLEECPNVFIKVNHELIPGRDIKVSSKENQIYKNKLKAMIEKIYPNYYLESFILNYSDNAIRPNCGFGEISIAPNGDVYWCNRIHELTSSLNVFKCNIADIFNTSEQIKRSTSVDNTSVCKDCEIKYICSGGCRIKYEGINDALNHVGYWNYKCDGKDDIYRKMINCNEYFFEK